MEPEQELGIRGALELLKDADPETRALIHEEVREIRWRRRQGIYLEWAGLGAGLVVWAGSMFAAVYLSVNEMPWVGGAIGTVDLVALVVVFVKGRGAESPQRAAATGVEPLQ